MQTLKTVFLILGSLIGAGYLSGAELIGFFRTDNLFFSLGISFSTLFLMLYLFLECGKKFGGYEGTLSVFGRKKRAVKTAIFIGNVVTASAMSASLGALFSGIPLFPAILGAVFCALFVRRGIKVVTAVDSVLVPLILLFLCFHTKELCFYYPTPKTQLSSGLVYAGMNAFFVFPVVTEVGKKERHPLVSALCASLLCLLGAVVILGNIFREGANSIGAVLPFAEAIKGDKLYLPIAVVAILTSLMSSLFPILPNSKKGTAVIVTVVLIISLLGLKDIVNYLYPVFGFCGLILTTFCLYKYLFRHGNQKVHRRRQKAK